MGEVAVIDVRVTNTPTASTWACQTLQQGPELAGEDPRNNPGTSKAPAGVSAGQGPSRLSQHSARPKGFEPLTF